MWRDDALLLDMLLASRKIRQFTQDHSWETFQVEEKTQHAVMRLIQIIGEAASKVSDGYKQEHSVIPWVGIIGMRHRLVHDYFNILLEKVWEVIVKDIPELIQNLEPLVPPEENLEKED